MTVIALSTDKWDDGAHLVEGRRTKSQGRRVGAVAWPPRIIALDTDSRAVSTSEWSDWGRDLTVLLYDLVVVV